MERKAREAGVAEMLAARDARAALQRTLLAAHGRPLISFTMNIAGSVKCDRWIEMAFQVGAGHIETQIDGCGGRVVESRRKVAFTGCEQIWAVDGAPADLLKRRMMALEAAGELGRLFDIDVIGADGQKLSRPGPERPCLICGGPVSACARSRVHTAEALFQRAQKIIRDHFRRRFIRRAADCAQRALLWEAVTTPKPGLVDCEDSGAHRDMDLFTFVDSACALRGYFEDCARAGTAAGNQSWEAVFDGLRCAGLEAEAEMLKATGGANTHKGALFSLGILCCAAGMGWDEPFSTEKLLERAGQIAQPALQELMEMDPGRACTGGERQYVRLGLTGARGEAASGFRTVRDVALPALEAALAGGRSLNDAGLAALVALMRVVQDSNIIRRRGMDCQREVMRRADRMLREGVNAGALREMNAWLVQEGVSPGGSADLLAATYFLHFMQEDDTRG